MSNLSEQHQHQQQHQQAQPQAQAQNQQQRQQSSQQETEIIETCPDDHHCLNGSKCVENPYSEGSYFCDCDEVVFDSAYEGLRCEHEADVYCVSEGVSKHSFCTNNGICIEEVGPDSAHMGCECPPEYEGSFCQFVKGTKPSGYPFLTTPTTTFTTASQNDTSRHTTNNGAVAVGVILGIVFGGLAVFGVFWWGRDWIGEKFRYVVAGSDPRRDNATGGDLVIEADGEGLKREMEGRNSSPTTVGSSRDVYEIGDDQVNGP